MGRILSPEVSGKISEIMFKNFSDDKKESFLRKEMERYVPQFTGWEDTDISGFIKYQRDIWLNNKVPELTKVIACLNPTFTDSVEGIHVTSSNFSIYTRASVKENGYRFQLHNGPQKGGSIRNTTAFTRQFTAYDLRMFPELHETLTKLPVMIGDAELINKRYAHLAGFNRVNERIPDMRYWPRKGTNRVDDEFLELYLQNAHLFKGEMPKEEFEMTLAFHGMFAIADPSTWNQSKKKQLENMVSLCSLPMDYIKVDKVLDELDDYIKKESIDARVVERKPVFSKKELKEYVEEKEKQDLEGVVVVQYAEDFNGNPSFDHAKSIKIKKYETIDTVLLGLYLNKKSDGLTESNLKGAMLGLYDEKLGCYLPVCKVNLDPTGVQIKTDGQRKRLNALRQELLKQVGQRKSDGKIHTLHDTYIAEAKIKLAYALGDRVNSDTISEMFDSMPKGQDLLSVISMYDEKKEQYDNEELGVKKSAPKKEKWIQEYKEILSTFSEFKAEDPNNYKSLMKYFSAYSGIKSASKKLIKPQYTVNTSEPIVLETQVFDIKYSLNPFAAGFHSWYGNSFKFNNCFAECIRHDKSTTTDYATVQALATRNTVRRRQK